MKRRLGGEHPRLDAEVDAFEPRAIEVAGRVADDHESVAVHARHREVAPLGDGLRSRRDHLPAAEDLADGRMQLDALELVMRIERRIAVVGATYQSDVDQAVMPA